MARIDYSRFDLPVRVNREDKKAVIRFGATAVRELIIPVDRLLAGALTPRDLQEELSTLESDDAFVSRGKGTHVLQRVAVDVQDEELAGFSWEPLLREAVRNVRLPTRVPTSVWRIVRTSVVRPRVADYPLTLPLRILQVDFRPDHPLPRWIQSMFMERPQQQVERAVVVHQTQDWTAPEGWATVDVLHLDQLRTLRFPDLALTTAKPSYPGTLGWILRQADRWQTRLMVVYCEGPEEGTVARQLGTRICGRGGPAVLVVEQHYGQAGPPASQFLYRAYDRLVQDQPLEALMEGDEAVQPALFVGAGREESLRISNVAVALLDLSNRLNHPLPAIKLVKKKLPLRNLKAPATYRNVRRTLTSLQKGIPTWEYHSKEKEGLLSLADQLHGLRASVTAPHVPRAKPQLMVTGGPSVASKATGLRFVNSSLWKDVDGDLQIVPQTAPPILAGSLYHLHIQVGPKDIRFRVESYGPLVEEVFRWTPEMKGIWVEVAVAGIDFRIAGDSVQELWLPRTGPSEPLYFAVTPKKPGVAMLRFGLYYRNNLVQSFRLAALVRANEQSQVEKNAQITMARMLGVPPENIGEAGYLARLEYSRIATLDQIERKRPRALAISVNKHNGRRILTIKGDDMHEVRLSPDDEMPAIVEHIRGILNRISYRGEVYQFPLGALEPEKRLKAAIRELASAGWRLYTNLVPEAREQQQIDKLLAGGYKSIQIAYPVRDKVIPWSFVYDRKYDPQRSTIDGRPVAQDVCMAYRSFHAHSPAPKCGDHPQCLLHPQQQALRKQQGLPTYDDQTVACPQRFWGFQHIIEIPLGRMDNEDDNNATGEKEYCIQPDKGGIQFFAGLNSTLLHCTSHWTELSKLLPHTVQPGYQRDDILDRLKESNLDLIYFYCHAAGGKAAQPPADPPFLQFQPDGEHGRICPPDFAASQQWVHGPLVFLNACGSLGYSPDALSPFLKHLVRGRGATGVIGTEVPVDELLAGPVAVSFIRKFCKGSLAGEALLEVRRELLDDYNPLGLVYTLYAPAELAIDHDRGGIGNAAPKD